MNPNAVSIKKVQQKSYSRHTTKRIIMSTVEFMFTVALTHVIICKPDKRYHQVKKEKSKEANMLENTVISANDGVSIYQSYLG